MVQGDALRLCDKIGADAAPDGADGHEVRAIELIGQNADSAHHRIEQGSVRPVNRGPLIQTRHFGQDHDARVCRPDGRDQPTC